MSSNEMSTDDVSSVEFTLQETYDYLLEEKSKMEHEVKELINIVQNNEVRTLGPNIDAEQIRLKRLKFIQSVAKFAAQEQPHDVLYTSTPEFYADTLRALEDEVHATESLNKELDKDISEIEKDIAYMEKKKSMFEQMREASLNAAENETSTSYEAEMNVTKRYFQDVKKDLGTVVDELFPDNRDFQDLLCVLTRALSKGGDDLYISIQPHQIAFANFLEDADVIQFHPHDNAKIKLINL